MHALGRHKSVGSLGFTVCHSLDGAIVGRSDVSVVMIKHHDQGNQLREEFVLVPFPDGWSP